MQDSERRDLNRIKGVPRDPPADEREHFIQCTDCGQWMDCRDLGDVLHHEEPGHGQIATQ